MLYTNENMLRKQKDSTGFTIVELLIVIVVIGILAAITIVSFNGVQAKAQQAKITSDLTQLEKAIIAARNTQSTTLMGLTGSGYSYATCTSKAAGTDFSTLPKNDTCWTQYTNDLAKISTASGINVNNLTDPWGRPYFIDENEGEGGGCGKDTLAAYTNPYPGGTSTISTSYIAVPTSGYSGCS